MIRASLLIIMIAVLDPAYACELASAQQKRLEHDLSLYYRVKSPPLEVAQHFSMQFLFCGKDSAMAVKRFKLDAVMPAHNHGMNYRAAIVTRDDAVIEASGLLFHMPGHWQLIVDFAIDAAIQRVKLDFYI